jgi:hypothetical protein
MSIPMRRKKKVKDTKLIRLLGEAACKLYSPPKSILKSKIKNENRY